MDLLKKYKTIILSIVILLVLAIIGFSYAYYNANVTVVSETQTIIRSKKLALTFNDTKEVNVADMIPGKSVEKTFNVVSTADDTVTYNIKWKDITSTYNEDLVYTLTRDGEVVAQQTLMPKTNPEEYILTNVSIDPNETHDYVLKMEFLYTDKPQGGGKALEFTGTVEIDVEKIETEIVHVPYTTNEISSTTPETSEEQTNTITNEFAVKSTSVNATQSYNVLLDDLTNEYEEGELTYSLEKNGEEISSGDVPQEGELSYLTTNEELQSGQTDTYNLTITENVDDTIAYAKERYEFSLLSNELAQTKALSKKFSAKVVIDKKEVDQTPPNAALTYATKTTNSVTFKASCIDEESGIKSYKFYKNGSLVETKETDEENIEYTYEKLETKEHEFKLVCTNSFKVETNATQRVTPTGLVEPQYEVASGAAQSKTVDITYTGAGTYLFKVNGEVTSNIDVIDCGTASNGAEFSCSETVVSKGTVLTEGKWYKVDSNPTLTFTSNGSIVAKVVDGTNYATGSSLDIAGIDREAPSIPEVESEYALGSWTNKDVTLKVSSTDNVEVDYYEYKISDGEWKKVTGNEIKFTEDMEEVVSIRAIDTAENISEIKEVEVKIDTKKPEITFDETENTTYAKSQSTKVSASDNVEVAELKYAWSTSDKEPTFENTFTNKDTVSIDNVTGKYYLWVSVKDSAGNITTTKTGLFYVDNTEPTCSISGAPTSWTTSATLSVTGTDTEKINVKPYSWDGSTYSTTQTNKVTSNGTYTAYVKDEAGNVGSCSKEVTKIDTTAPNTPTLSVSSKTTNSIILKGGCSDAESGITTYAFYMDGTLNKSYSTTAASQSHTINKVTSGEHTYKLVCTNGSKLTSNTSITASVKDLVIPTYSVPSGYAQSKNVTISYSGDGAYLFKATGSVTSNVVVTDCGTTSTEGTYSCTTTTVAAGTALAEGNWYKVDSNPTLTFTSNGSIIAKVADGTNYKAGSSLNVENIDTTLPTCSISGNPTSWVQSATLKVTGTDTNLADSPYSWDGTNYSTTQTKTVTANGTYIAYVKDKAGNVKSCSVEVTKIDRSAPNVTFGTNGSTTYAKSQSTVVTVSDTAGLGTLMYQWTQSTTTPAASTFTTTFTSGATITKNTGTGNNWYLWIYAKDAIGNEKIVKSNAFYIDNTVPSTCTISGNPTAWATSATLTVSGADDNSGLAVSPYSWDETNYSTNQTKTVTANGTYTAYVKDKAGNVKSCSVSVTKIDRTGPNVTFSPDGSTTYAKSQSTVVTVSDQAGLGTLMYQWVKGTTTPTDASFTTTFTSGTTLTTPETTGSYYLWVYVKDSLGNVTKKKTTNYFNVDVTPPNSCTITGNPTAYAQSAILTVSGADANSGLHATQPYSWDGSTYSTTQTKTITANGTYTAYVKDKAGNVKSCSVSVNMIDRTGPSVTFGTDGNTTYAKSHSTKVTASDQAGLGTLMYQWVDGTTTPTDASFTTKFTSGTTLTTPATTGKYYLWIYAKDSLGNATKKKTTTTFNVDVTTPSCTISGNPTSWVTSATLSVSGTDNVALNESPYSWDGSTYSTTQTKAITANGTYTAYVKDKVGNVKSCGVSVTKIDTTAPSAPVLGTVSNYGKSLTVAFTAGADAESGVTHTCYYAEVTSSNTAPDPNVAGALSGTTCSFNNLKQGTTYRYKVCATNGAGTQTCSSVGSATTYTGVVAGNYTTGSTVSYGGLTWYVLGDTGAAKGSYLKLVLNTVSGNGTYNNANTYLNSTFLNTYSAINTDKSRGGLVAQGSNYVTTDSGTTAYRPNYVYWNKSGYVVIPNAVPKYALSSYTVKVFGARRDSDLLYDARNNQKYYAGVTSSTLYSAGQNVALANTSSAITYANGGYNTATGGPGSHRSTTIMPDSTLKTPTSSLAPAVYQTWYNALDSSGNPTSSEAASKNNKDTKDWHFHICGENTWIRIYAKSATQYRFVNTTTGVDEARNYSKEYMYEMGGAAVFPSGTSKSFELQNSDCGTYTMYSLKNTSAAVYYRPYILVREAYAS